MATQSQSQVTDQNAQSAQLELVKKDISAQVLARVEIFQKSGELRIPKDYSPENALKSAYLILTDPRNNLLAQCTKESAASGTARRRKLEGAERMRWKRKWTAMVAGQVN